MERKIIKIAILVVLLMLSVTNVVNALGLTATLTPSSTNVEADTEFIVTLKLTNMDIGTSQGFSSVEGTLSYDTSIFETIGQSSFNKLNNWNPTYDAESKKLKLTSSIATKTDTSVCQITFKTKSDIKQSTGKATTGTIKFENITASSDVADAKVSSVSTTITIGSAENVNANINANVNSSQISVNSNENSPSYINNVNTTEEDMPNTGAEDTAFVLLAAVVAIGIVFYVKYEKLNNDINR